jgi:CRP-like cAMP-binding protein
VLVAFLDLIQPTLQRYCPTLSSKSRYQITSLCSLRNLNKHDFLTNEGKSNHSEYILVDGILRSFLLDNKGKEITISFFTSESVLSPALTRTNKGKSLLNLQALTDAELLEMDAAAFEKLIEENLEIREFANMVVRIELMGKVHKELRMASWTALERLEQFRIDFKNLENVVAHHMIASYLGITNVSLSRLRGQR